MCNCGDCFKALNDKSLEKYRKLCEELNTGRYFANGAGVESLDKLKAEMTEQLTAWACEKKRLESKMEQSHARSHRYKHCAQWDVRMIHCGYHWTCSCSSFWSHCSCHSSSSHCHATVRVRACNGHCSCAMKKKNKKESTRFQRAVAHVDQLKKTLDACNSAYRRFAK